MIGFEPLQGSALFRASSNRRIGFLVMVVELLYFGKVNYEIFGPRITNSGLCQATLRVHAVDVIRSVDRTF